MALTVKHTAPGAILPSLPGFTAKTVEYLKPRTRRGHIIEPAKIRLRSANGTYQILEAPGIYIVANEEGHSIARYVLGDKPKARKVE